MAVFLFVYWDEQADADASVRKIDTALLPEARMKMEAFLESIGLPPTNYTQIVGLG